MLVPLWLSVGLVIIHYYSEYFHDHCSRKKITTTLLSFVAGISVSYLFLYLLPELTAGVQHLDNLLFFFLLTGFTLFHVIEKYIYQHETGYKRRKDLSAAHTSAFFIYYILIGIVLVRLSALGMRDTTLFFVPIALHSAVSSFSLKEVHSAQKETNLMRLLLSSSPLIGVLFALNFTLESIYFYSVLGFLGGTLLYIVIRDSIPYGKKGKPLYFLIGAFLYAIVVFLTQNGL